LVVVVVVCVVCESVGKQGAFWCAGVVVVVFAFVVVVVFVFVFEEEM